MSALVDGQLDAETSGRMWRHVVDCPSCRRAVEAETWVKRKVAVTRLAEPSARLIVNLHRMPAAADAWAAAQSFEERSAGRRRAALLGAGSLSLALVGFAALSGVLPGVLPDGGPAADLTGSLLPSPTPTDSATEVATDDSDPGGAGPLLGPGPTPVPDEFTTVVLAR